jgi:hypothetical protein
MATLVTYTRTDSLDPRISTDVEDVVFFNPLTGEKLEIQLGAANRKHFENHLAKLQKYIDAAEVVEVPVVETKPKAAAKNSENAKVRAWAKENGFNIGDRGRISAEIQEAYKAAHEVIDSASESDAETVSSDEPISEVGTSENTSQEADVEAKLMLGDVDVMAMIDQIEAENAKQAEQPVDENTDTE